MHIVLKSLAAVIETVRQEQAQGYLPYTIPVIQRAISTVTQIDRIEITGFDSPGNPIHGKFVLYQSPPGVYAESEPKVEVFYSQELNYCWQRFVICKELCHALEEGDDTRVNTIEDLDKLVEALILPPEASVQLSGFAPFNAERFAELAALELLCPRRDRKALMRSSNYSEMSEMQIATLFRIPTQFVALLFDKRYISAVDSIFSDSTKK